MEEGFIKRYSHHSMSNVEDPRTKPMLDARGREVDCLTDRRRMEYPKETYGCSSIISKSKLIANKDPFLKNDVLLLRCTFKIGKDLFQSLLNILILHLLEKQSKFTMNVNKSSISYGTRKTFKNIRDKLFSRIPSAIDLIESKPETSNEEEKDHSTFSCASRSLKNALKGLLEDGVLSDAILRTGGEFFPIHRNIVSARSPVFRRMFDKEMRENEFIDVPDLDADTLRNLLLFLYTETVKDLQWQNASQLFKAAHLYQIRDCERLPFFLKGESLRI
ncbi:BTB domain-containing protein [Caerostris extrusa]|uniref:BTB domain-containing protein n=1 Tax=Caerostris extrusa TaxID=172846 RepID=A0AAV4UTJ2_CAEEX|nr:BTB domain-containing protein [Caerostris extrusa]